MVWLFIYSLTNSRLFVLVQMFNFVYMCLHLSLPLKQHHHFWSIRVSQAQNAANIIRVSSGNAKCRIRLIVSTFAYLLNAICSIWTRLQMLVQHRAPQTNSILQPVARKLVLFIIVRAVSSPIAGISPKNVCLPPVHFSTCLLFC